MKAKAVFLALLSTVASTHGGEFVNLSFEDADPKLLVPHTWGYGARMVPGWLGDATVGYNQGVFQFGVFMLIDEWGRARREEFAEVPIVGSLAIGVVPNAFYTGMGEPNPPILQQRGLVPADASALQFVWKGENLRVFMDGQSLSVSFLEHRAAPEDTRVPFHDYYTADVSAFAGKEATLRFEFRANAVHGSPDWPERLAVLDDLRFVAIVPEPSTWALLALGGVAVAWRLRRQSTG